MLVWPNIPKRAITREKRVFAIELSDRYGRAFELHMARFSGGLKRRPCGNKCTRPAHISRKSGTHIVQKQTGKGPAVRFVKRYIGSNARLAAIGDSEETSQCWRRAITLTQRPAAHRWFGNSRRKAV